MPSTLDPSSRPRRRVPVAGFSLVEAMVLIALVAVVIGAVMSVSIQGARDERGAHDRQEALQAAADRLGGDVPREVGGSVAPSAPVDGWSDVVYPQGGGYRDAAGGTTPSDAPLIRRQWQLRDGPDGSHVLDVSAELVDRAHEPIPGRDGYSVVLSRAVR